VSWVTSTVHISVNHHLRHVGPDNVAVAECGAKLARFVLARFPEVAECRSCAEHVYARDKRRACPHCGKTPRKAA
jgi:Zn finger protein HypA/HybF involved in hydrogenase expression